MDHGNDASAEHEVRSNFASQNRNRSNSSSLGTYPGLLSNTKNNSLRQSGANDSDELYYARNSVHLPCLSRLSAVAERRKATVNELICSPRTECMLDPRSSGEQTSCAELTISPGLSSQTHEKQVQSLFLGIRSNYSPAYLQSNDELFVSMPLGLMMRDLWGFFINKGELEPNTLQRQVVWLQGLQAPVLAPVHSGSDDSVTFFPILCSSDAPLPSGVYHMGLERGSLTNALLFHEMDTPLRAKNLLEYLSGDSNELEGFCRSDQQPILNSSKPLSACEIDTLLGFLQQLPCPAGFGCSTMLKKQYDFQQILQTPRYTTLRDAIDIYASVKLVELTARLLPYTSHSVLTHWKTIPRTVQLEQQSSSNQFFCQLNTFMEDINARMDLTEYIEQQHCNHVEFNANMMAKMNNTDDTIYINNTSSMHNEGLFSLKSGNSCTTKPDSSKGSTLYSKFESEVDYSPNTTFNIDRNEQREPGFRHVSFSTNTSLHSILSNDVNDLLNQRSKKQLHSDSKKNSTATSSTPSITTTIDTDGSSPKIPFVQQNTVQYPVPIGFISRRSFSSSSNSNTSIPTLLQGLSRMLSHDNFDFSPNDTSRNSQQQQYLEKHPFSSSLPIERTNHIPRTRRLLSAISSTLLKMHHNSDTNVESLY